MTTKLQWIQRLKTGTDAGQRARTFAYYIAFIGLGISTASFGPTLLGLSQHTHTHLNEISFLFTIRSMGYLLGSYGSGRLYDRLKGHPMMAAALLLMSAMLALIPTISVLWALAVVLLLLGIGEGALDVGGNTLLLWVHNDDVVGPFMNGLHLFYGFGALITPIIIAQTVLASGDINWAYWGLSLLVLPAVIWLLRLPSPAVRKVEVVRGQESFPLRIVLLITLYYFLIVGGEGSFSGWLFTYARAQNLANETVAAYLTSVFWALFTLGRILSIPLSARYHPRSILMVDLIGCSASLGVILLGQRSFTITLLGAAGMGLFAASIFPTMLTFAQRQFTITGRINGWFFAGASAGGMFIPWLIGQFFEPVGPWTSMVIILVCITLALLVLLMIGKGQGKETRKSRTMELDPDLHPM